MKRVCVLLLPGSNCEQEMMRALNAVSLEPHLVHYSDVWRASAYDAFCLVGGFAFEDRIRAGVIAALLPQVRSIHREARKGKPVLGVCNGAQVLVEGGLLDSGDQAVALAPNRPRRVGGARFRGFFSGWVQLFTKTKTLLTQTVKASQPLWMPVAHAEGRFLFRAEAPIRRALLYASPRGKVSPSFPWNPNGSQESVAAVGNRAGNVLAMMPHPERSCFYYQLPAFLKRSILQQGGSSQPFSRGPGLAIFDSMRQSLLH